ncbi:NUDIX hydrolase [Acuticoccus yangtzensis]|uniref:NUDIX hydrolase n=1 Tax=Acuticoccus yangtzensis TaxID=1443441 RepID=UPI0009497AF9|nr:NUDIX hydrolase [Acuticoccus yangtzensis]ORE96616.1 NUDIX family hydrolase [Stappia sp. 22II-S9-Z10]
MSELTAAERLKRDAEQGHAGHRKVTIRDAATLILIDPKGPSVLMGRRSMKHVFMPGRYVFPGGRVDPTDSRVRLDAPYDDATLTKLTLQTRAKHGEARARALGAAAIREVYEETGVLVGRQGAETLPDGPAWQAFRDRGVGLDFSRLRFVFRAITPPGRPRRFDTRFFAVPHDAIAEIDPSRVGDDAELEEIAWVTLDDARKLELPGITHTVIDALAKRLKETPELPPGGPVPFFRMVRGERTMVVL